ncbi:hypothetical protein GCM10027176_34810 [Actinoallomurus bryophytorum]|uniref:Uncharacterized protein n=1 Tax=Actinoallomurus bryophytorum TaxID=1490222 RepID=A0A543CIT4_9ACTN|nr:hypothetical protein [Actinoallomurus bryophytorum]TQL96817.1 hypothetical protein FB559_2370 [Actinoallomurus bryophytorum]
MRYRGNRRQVEVSATDSRGRHRRSKDSVGEHDRPATVERAAGRPRRLQPRDARGRFRKIEPADRLSGARDGDAVPEDRAKPRYTWRDFELDEDLPRAAPHPADAVDLRDGRRHCGALEGILYRQWAADGRSAPPDAVRAVDSLAELPEALKDKLAEGLDGIYVGSGGVPDLDDMQYLRGAPLPSGKATWDICAGAYGDRTIVVGDRPSPTPDVMLHEIGHALDDIDGRIVEDGPRQWQSDSAEFRALYEQCLPHFASDFHIGTDDLGRHEFFADAFAAIASRQRPALVDMLGGNTRAALNVMLFFNRKYGI